MPHKIDDMTKRKKGKDKVRERYIRNNGYSSKHIRIKENEKENSQKKDKDYKLN